MQDNEYKEQAQKAIKEAEKLKKENLELEKKLKTATKQEYEQKLSLQAQQLVQTQKQREIELNKMALQAKEQYIKLEKIQKQEEIERQRKLNELQKKIEQEQLEMQRKIEQEKNNIKRAELENQAKIKELESIAGKEKLIFDMNVNRNKISIQQVVNDSVKIKEKIKNIKKDFAKLHQKNIDNLSKSYDKQIEILNKSEFKKKEPEKNLFETTEDFNARMAKYCREKESFYYSKENKIYNLENNKERAIMEDENRTDRAMNETLKPFINKLIQFQENYYYGKYNKKVKMLPIEEVYADEYCFVITVIYDDQKYKLYYYFNDIGIKKAELMHKTQNQFIIEPLFSVEESNGTVKPIVVAFDVKHLGTKIKKRMCLYKDIPAFSEINDY